MKPITFPEIAKMIHPDLNPSIDNPGEKMALVTQNKNNPSFLFNLAVRWGLIKGHTQGKVYYFNVGNVINYLRNRKAVIVDVVKKSVIYEVVFIDIVKNVLKKMKLINVNISEIGGISVLGKASEQSFSRALFLYGVWKKQEEERKRVVLRPYMNYRGKNFQVWAMTLRRRITLTRTTSKRAYYWDERTNKERFVLIKNVREI